MKAKFNPDNREHLEIVERAIQSAESFGVSKIRTVKEQLEMYDIEPNLFEIEKIIFERY